MRTALVVALLFLLPGCATFLLPPDPCVPPDGWLLTGPFDPEGRIRHPAVDEATDNRILFFIRNPGPDDVYYRASLRRPGESNGSWGSSFETPNPPRLLATNGTAMDAIYPLFWSGTGPSPGLWAYEWSASFTGVECAPSEAITRRLDFADMGEGERARPGVGALVYTAGFWTNGTLFYTNMDRVNNDSAFPHAGWYEYEGGAPLSVYLYNSTRSELPPRYKQAGYVTTIKGFNAGLRGLMVGSSDSVYVKPHDAYTSAGNETHPLYGDTLVFYIEVADVVAINCPYPEPVCEQPAPPLASQTETLTRP